MENSATATGSSGSTTASNHSNHSSSSASNSSTATSSSSSSSSNSSTGSSSTGSVDRLKALYPFVNEEETPLPRSWSSKDKYTFIGLSQNNLRVHYKGTSRFPLICIFIWL